MNIVTILITVIIINWNFKTPRTNRMPGWVRAVFLNYLPRALLMTRPHHAQRSSKKAYSRRNYRPSIGSRFAAAAARPGAPECYAVPLGAPRCYGVPVESPGFAAAAAGAPSSPELAEFTEVRRMGPVKRRPLLGPIMTSARDDLTSGSLDPAAATAGLPFRL